MATFKEISAADIKTSRSSLNQLVDVVQEDVSGSTTRKKHLVFVTGGIGPGVTSSLFQTVHDQDFTLQTANPIFDVTVGLFYSGSTVLESSTGEDTSGKQLFPSTSLMMREKVDIYKQYAQTLLGNSTAQFVAPFGSTEVSSSIGDAMFVSFKRLFARDKIKRETFAMRFYQTASLSGRGATPYEFNLGGVTDLTGSNIDDTATSGSTIYTDIGSSTNKRTTFGGEVGDIVDSSDTSRSVGLMFYDAGCAVFDLKKVLWGDQHALGVVDSMNASTYDAGLSDIESATGDQVPGTKGHLTASTGQAVLGSASGCDNATAKFIPDFLVSASLDNIVDHLMSSRLQSGSLTAMTFQNVTNINSTLIFCRATADEFNYSSNPTFIDSDDRIVVIDEGQEDTQRTFTFASTVGLYDANDNLLAVAKMSRPIEKNDEKDITVRVRLDF